jgi:hypothetical protein
VDHRYSQAPLPPGHPAFVARTPGVREVVRLFPEPSLADHGSLGVEGGLTFVAGPGMGRTSLLLHLQDALEAERRIPCARVAVPDGARALGFHAFLGSLAEAARTALLASPSVAAPEHDALRAVLSQPITADVPEGQGALTPRGLQDWIGGVGRAAAQGRGCCLLFDDLDRVAGAEWAGALVAGLRFTFQAASGVTPAFALWHLYFEESMPGSNYFRNVTRPLFVAPLEGPERAALFGVDLGGLPPEARVRVDELAGGHPQLLQRLLGGLASALAEGEAEALTPAAVDLRLLPGEAARQEAVRTLLARVPQLRPALGRLDALSPPLAFSSLPPALATSGLARRDERGMAVLPAWIREGL